MSTLNRIRSSHMRLGEISTSDIEAFALMTPQRLLRVDTIGNMPIHTVLYSPTVSLNVIESIASSAPSCLWQKDAYGDYPLHIALYNLKAWNGLPCATICQDIALFLMKQSSSTVSMKNGYGDYPIHVALCKSLLSVCWTHLTS